MPRVPTGRDGGELVERVRRDQSRRPKGRQGRSAVISFTALVVVGDEVDQVGIGYGKAREVPVAIQKAVDDAKKNMFKVPKRQNTITHEVLGVFGARRVMLKPASAGTGVIAGAGVQALLELARICDVLSKSLGTSNPINLCRAAETALRSLRHRRTWRSCAASASTTSCRRRLERHRRRARGRRHGRGRRRRSRRAARRGGLMALKVTQVSSSIRVQQEHRGTMRALGLGRIGKTRVHRDSPSLQGRLHQVGYLVRSRRSLTDAARSDSTTSARRAARSARASASVAAWLGHRQDVGPRPEGPEGAVGLAHDAGRLRGRSEPLYMRTGKLRGAHEEVDAGRPFRTTNEIVNVADLAERFGAGTEVTPATLVAAGLLKNTREPVKVLGRGELSVP